MIKRYFIAITFFLFLIGCNSKETKISIAKKDITIIGANNPNQNWIESFNEFRDAIYQNDKIKLKSFFRFPLANPNNEIWDAIRDEPRPDFVYCLVKPFSETDFDANYLKLFNKHFINSILKIKTKELFETGEYETIMLSEGELYYKTFATYNKESKQIVLNFYTEEKVEIDGEYEKAEFSKIYYFNILSNNKLQFNHIRLAG